MTLYKENILVLVLLSTKPNPDVLLLFFVSLANPNPVLLLALLVFLSLANPNPVLFTLVFFVVVLVFFLGILVFLKKSKNEQLISKFKNQ